MTFGKKIGANLLRYMITHELSQGEVAIRSGLTQPVISGLVTGITKDPPISTVFKLTSLPGLTLEILLKGVSAKSLPGLQRNNKTQVARLEEMLEEIEREIDTIERDAVE